MATARSMGKTTDVLTVFGFFSGLKFPFEGREVWGSAGVECGDERVRTPPAVASGL
jgi:hypothetical protein